MTESASLDHAELAQTGRTLPILLLKAREAVMEKFRPILAAENISEQQWRVIRVLREFGETDATTLAEHACVLAPSLTRMLKALETRGFVEIRKDEADARRSLIAVTQSGRDFIAAVSPLSIAIYAEMEQKLGEELLTRLVDDLEQLLSALHQS